MKILRQKVEDLSKGDIARYHGSDLQGKQVQKLLNNAREKQNLIFLTAYQKTEQHMINSIKILADVSDVLKMPIEKFDEENNQMKSFGQMNFHTKISHQKDIVICFARNC